VNAHRVEADPPSVAERLCRALPPILAYRLATRVFNRKGPKHDLPFVTRTVTGALFRSSSGDLIVDQVRACGFWDWRVQALAAEFCPPGSCIVEVGANTGTETVGFADIVGPSGLVVAFEPDPAIFHSLTQNVALNAFHNVRSYNCAVGDRSGEMRFVSPPSTRNSGQGYVTSLDAPATGTITVRVVTLDSLAAELGAIGMLVVDVEGFEVGVLRGARDCITAQRPVLVVEAVDSQLQRAGTDLRGLETELRALDYRVFEINRLSVRGFDAGAVAGVYHKNWLCLPSERAGEVRRANRIIAVCGLMPGLGRLNPLRRFRP
jgi:FkbM family methyltransferase